MRRLYLAGLSMLALALSPLTPTDAEARERIGYGRLINNDATGDGKDRWRTGSVVSSRVWGPQWTGALPQQAGQLLELRFKAEIIAPDDLRSPAPGDRRYSTSLSLGLHTHFDWQGFDTAIGGDLVGTGDGLGLRAMQDGLHDLLGVEGTSGETRDAAVDGGVHPTLVLESGRRVQAGPAELRPFVETRVGDETLVRAGLDIRFGRIGEGELWMRDPVTGQRYRVVRDHDVRGVALVLGGDIAHVADSIYLSDSELREDRTRLRAGMHWQGRRSAAFYGVSWLGEEFEAQDEGQLVGSIRLRYDF